MEAVGANNARDIRRASRNAHRRLSNDLVNQSCLEDEVAVQRGRPNAAAPISRTDVFSITKRQVTRYVSSAGKNRERTGATWQLAMVRFQFI
jgi:hypothetical protein